MTGLRALLPVLARRRDERGATVVMALAFLSLFGIAVAALLAYADAAFRTTRTARALRAELYAVDGALDAAIATVRPVVEAGRDGLPCPALDAPPIGGIAVRVTCDPLPGSGSAQGGSVNDSNRPRWAVQALGAPGEPAIDQGSNHDLRISGDVFAGGAVQSHPARLVGDATVIARGTCDATKVVAPTVRCNETGAVPDSSDPAWGPLSPTAPTNAPALPSCATGQAVVAFEPGRYTDAAGLNARTSGGACTGKVLWFKPGVYHFDFAGPQQEWLIDGAVTIVGGTPKGWSPTSPSPSVQIPGACARDGDPAPNDGVQLVFSGASRLAVDGGRTELCPPPALDRQQIAIYGATPSTGGGYTSQSGCVTTVGGCAFLQSRTNSVTFVSHGTVYAPLAKVVLRVTNQATHVFGRGIVVRSASLHITPATSYDGPLVALPPASHLGADRQVRFTASIDGRPRRRAVVTFLDGLGATPGLEARVRSWAPVT